MLTHIQAYITDFSIKELAIKNTLNFIYALYVAKNHIV